MTSFFIIVLLLISFVLIDSFEVTITRHNGLFGTIAVDYKTNGNTAVSHHGKISVFGIESYFNTSRDNELVESHHFEVNNKNYLMMSFQDGSTKLYRWQGTFVYVKVRKNVETFVL